MAQRVLESYRLHPIVHEWLGRKGKELGQRSRAYMIEWCVKVVADREIDPRFEPGIKMDGDDE